MIRKEQEISDWEVSGRLPEEMTFELGSGKWSEFEQMTVADTEAGVEKEFPSQANERSQGRVSRIHQVCADG